MWSISFSSEQSLHFTLSSYLKVQNKVVWSQTTDLCPSFSVCVLTVSTYPAPSLSSCTGRATYAPVWRSTSTSLSTIWQRSTSLLLSRRPAPSKVGPQTTAHGDYMEVDNAVTSCWYDINLPCSAIMPTGFIKIWWVSLKTNEQCCAIMSSYPWSP